MADFTTMLDILNLRQTVQEDLRPYAVRAVTEDWTTFETECADTSRPIRRQIAYKLFSSLVRPSSACAVYR